MSRSGRIPISIPENTEIKIENNVSFLQKVSSENFHIILNQMLKSRLRIKLFTCSQIGGLYYTTKNVGNR